ncbi:MAG: SHOCT domain-containing protein [Gammaproteobacteria bacterium]|nr:SHOCT domain-containing protein [Gammaproteobacteria bacterium]
MFDHDGWMIFGGGLMWLFWIVLIVLLVMLFKSLFTTNTDTRPPAEDSPLTILKKRYARGEIDEDEFERRRKELES